jgi:hypothetical protein
MGSAGRIPLGNVIERAKAVFLQPGGVPLFFILPSPQAGSKFHGIVGSQAMVDRVLEPLLDTHALRARNREPALPLLTRFFSFDRTSRPDNSARPDGGHCEDRAAVASSNRIGAGMRSLFQNPNAFGVL